MENPCNGCPTIKLGCGVNCDKYSEFGKFKKSNKWEKIVPDDILWEDAWICFSCPVCKENDITIEFDEEEKVCKCGAVLRVRSEFLIKK